MLLTSTEFSTLFSFLQIVAADLLAQAEHDTAARAILVTTSEALIASVCRPVLVSITIVSIAGMFAQTPFMTHCLFTLSGHSRA